jgi:glycosyltransferase involved in cell wall biosynthesis
MATIGIDATALSTSACGGIGTAQYQTMQALARLDTQHRFVLYAATPPVIPFTRRPLDLPWPVRLGSGPLTRSNIVWMQTGVNRLLANDGVELFWGPRHLLPFRAQGLRNVATLHDFIHRYYPEEQAWPNRLANRLLIARSATRADVVVTPSASLAAEAAHFLAVDRARVRVVPWGVDSEVFHKRPDEDVATLLGSLGIEMPYLLCLEIYNLRKNFRAVLEAVARLPNATRRSLTIVGLGRRRKSAYGVDVEDSAKALGLAAQMRLPGDFSQRDLAALYSGAAALVYPSLYEGFGLPVLEAMACGCPVVTSNRSSLPEVAGDAALLVDPESPDQLADAIARLAGDTAERARLVAAGRQRARLLTWELTAQGMLAAFDEAMGAGATC